MTDTLKIAASQGDGWAPGAVGLSASVPAESQRGGAGPGYWLSEDDVKLRIQGLPTPYPVVLLGPSVAWFEPDCQTLYPFDQRVTVELLHAGREIGPLSASLTLQSVGMRGPLVGVQLHDVPARAGHELLAVLQELVAGGAKPAAASLLQRVATGEPVLTHEVIDEPKRVRSVMSVLVKRKGIVRRAGGSAPPLCVLLDDVVGDEVKWRALEGWSDAATVDIAGRSSIFRVSVRGEQVRRGEIVSPLPVRIERLRQSLQQRGVKVELTARFLHPLTPHLPPVEGEVVDVSFSGLRLSIREAELSLHPRLKISLELQDGEGGVIHLRGEVRSVSAGDDARGSICSVYVVATRPEDERRWLRLVSRILHATTHGGRHWQAELWNLFASSGYFNLSGRRPEHFDVIKPSFLRMAQKAAEVPHLLYNVACLSENGMEGNFSMMKPYHSTWMLHQLAKRPRSASNVSSRQVLRDMYTRCFEHAQSDQEVRWIMAYAEAGVAWNERAFFEFARARKATGLVLSLPFRLTGVDAPAGRSDDRPADTGAEGGFEVGEGTASEQADLLGRLAETSPRAYREALDLVPGEFTMRAFIERWRSVGLERDRALLVARRGGEPPAAAIVEIGEVGTNLFQLLDSARLIPMRPGGDVAFTPLLDAVCDWFRSRKRTSFVHFSERGKLSYAGRASLPDLGEGRLWILAAELVPEFMAHVYRLTTPKPPGS